MNWKVATGLISAIAALIAGIATFDKKESPSVGIVASGNQNIQIQGSGNSVTLPSTSTKKISIPIFKGQLKEDGKAGGDSESFKLAKSFNSFISENENKIVQLDVFNFYTDEDWDRPEEHGMKLYQGFPDPRQFELAEECVSGLCSGYNYEILGKLDEITYNPAATARFIRGYFRVKIVAATQGWIFVKLKPVSDEHVDVLTQ